MLFIKQSSCAILVLVFSLINTEVVPDEATALVANLDCLDSDIHNKIFILENRMFQCEKSNMTFKYCATYIDDNSVEYLDAHQLVQVEQNVNWPHERPEDGHSDYRICDQLLNTLENEAEPKLFSELFPKSDFVHRMLWAEFEIHNGFAIYRHGSSESDYSFQRVGTEEEVPLERIHTLNLNACASSHKYVTMNGAVFECETKESDPKYIGCMMTDVTENSNDSYISIVKDDSNFAYSAYFYAYSGKITTDLPTSNDKLCQILYENALVSLENNDETNYKMTTLTIEKGSIAERFIKL